jgi:hypothetical protein
MDIMFKPALYHNDVFSFLVKPLMATPQHAVLLHAGT